MKKLLLVFAMIAASVILAQPSVGADQDCPDLSTGKLSAGNQETVTFDDVPEGYVIDYYCVKAGSANQGDGPVIVQVNPNAESVTISHPSGKEISHYSVQFVRDTPDEPDTPDKDKDKEPADKAPADRETSDEVASLPASGA